ncbi:unnamed protein product, partial [Larinioides sclopetarius]
RNPTSVYCVKSDLSAAAFLDILVKYKANGVCRTLGQNTGELVPGEKFEEFYEIREVAGPELTLKGANWICEIT